MACAWHPYDEAEAAGAGAAFIEWLRATKRWEAADPAEIAAWPGRDSQAFATALAEFAGLDPARTAMQNLLQPVGGREALVLYRGGRWAWSRDALRGAARDLPRDIASVLEGLDWPGLIDIAAHHLLAAGTRPDDRLLWAGAVTDRLPYGALLLGATLILADDPAADPGALAMAEGAVVITPPRGSAPG